MSDYDELVARLSALAQPTSATDGDSAGLWHQVGADDAMPAYGWKLHISAGLDNAAEVLQAAYPVLKSERMTFKYARSLEVLANLNAGWFGIVQVGKMITAYPGDEESLVSVAGQLHQRLEHQTGPRPLSDRQVPGSSCLSYRYGSLRSDSVELPDERMPGCAVPRDRADPFAVSAISPDGSTESPPLLCGRFLVTGLIRQRGKGGVYRAIDYGGGALGSNPPIECVLKEARRFGERDAAGVDAWDRLARQVRVLQSMEAYPAFARIVTVAQSGDSRFLAMRSLPCSSSVLDVAASDERLSAQDIVGLCDQVHDRIVLPLSRRGVAWNDLSADNVLVSQEGRVYCADVEEATSPEAARLILGTPGYSSAKVPPCTVLSDVYALLRLAVLLDNRRWYALVRSGDGGALHRPVLDRSGGVHRWCLNMAAEYGIDREDIFSD